MARRGRLEQCLQVAVGPLAKRPFLPNGAACIERLAQIHHEPLPLLLGEPSLEIDGPSDTDRQPEKLARCRAAELVDRIRRLRDSLRSDPHVATDLLKLGERQPVAGSQVRLARLPDIGRLCEDGGDFILVESSVCHSIRKIALSAATTTGPHVLTTRLARIR